MERGPRHGGEDTCGGIRQDLKTKKTEETFDPFENGGLDDDHASSVHPNFPRA